VLQPFAIQQLPTLLPFLRTAFSFFSSNCTVRASGFQRQHLGSGLLTHHFLTFLATLGLKSYLEIWFGPCRAPFLHNLCTNDLFDLRRFVGI
jgi:hypothetical protein